MYLSYLFIFFVFFLAALADLCLFAPEHVAVAGVSDAHGKTADELSSLRSSKLFESDR